MQAAEVGQHRAQGCVVSDCVARNAAAKTNQAKRMLFLKKYKCWHAPSTSGAQEDGDEDQKQEYEQGEAIASNIESAASRAQGFLCRQSKDSIYSYPR